MFIDTATGPLEWCSLGPPHGECVVLEHYAFGTCHSLMPLARAMQPLCPDFRFIACSRPGCGQSPPLSPARPGDYLEREGEDVLPAFLEALSLSRVHLIGHSDGGSIVLIAAATLGRRIASLSAIAPHVILEERTVSGIGAFEAANAGAAFRAELASKHARPDVAYDGWRDVWLDPANRDWSIVERLGAISCPVQLVQGDEDAFATFAQLDLIEQNVTVSCHSHRLIGHGHVPHRSAQGDVARWCAQHLLANRMT